MVSGLSPETGCRKYIQAGVVKDTSSAISKSDLLVSISLLLVSKSDLLVSISLLLVSKSDLPVSISLLLMRKSDLLASISLLLVSKSDFLVADQLTSFSDDLSTLRRNPSLA